MDNNNRPPARMPYIIDMLILVSSDVTRDTTNSALIYVCLEQSDCMYSVHYHPP